MQTQLRPSVKASELAMTGSAVQANEERVRIVHVLASLGNGGTEFGIVKLRDGLRDDLFEHRICITRQFDAQFVETHNLKNILFVAAGTRKGLQFPLFRLYRIFKQYRPHIVHTRNWGGLEAVLAARLARVPIVIHSEHGYEVGNLKGLPLRQRVFRRLAYSMTHRVFALTNELRGYHAKQSWTSSERIRVIYNGVDTARFAPSHRLREAARRAIGIPQRSFVVGSVGRLVPIKDYGTLLRSAELLVQRGIPVHVLLVGCGSEKERLEAEVSSSAYLNGQVTFAGSPDRVPELLNAMDVFVLPSLSEGMSNTLLEAMATGLPLLATRVGGNPEVLGEAFSEWLFPAGNAQDLAGRLQLLANDPETRLRLGTALRERALTIFSLEGMMQRYSDLYRDIAVDKGVVHSARNSAKEKANPSSDRKGERRFY